MLFILFGALLAASVLGVRVLRMACRRSLGVQNLFADDCASGDEKKLQDRGALFHTQKSRDRKRFSCNFHPTAIRKELAREAGPGQGGSIERARQRVTVCSLGEEEVGCSGHANTRHIAQVAACCLSLRGGFKSEAFDFRSTDAEELRMEQEEDEEADDPDDDQWVRSTSLS